MTNRDEIIRALRLLFVAGDVFEIRVLKAVTGSYQRPHTESGYFDYEHIPQVADALGQLRSFAGAYVTLNPVDHDLLARAFNRLAAADHSSTTADGDTLCRRWLPIDCDPDRKSGISSSDEEHEAALSLAREIRDGLASLGWPAPIMLDSGNGAQMLYRIDLPANDDNLVQNAITSIAGASNDRVHVDTAVFNPARIWRIPGTMNCKGDSVPDRPHRLAHIISVPDTVQCVPQEKLTAVVSRNSTQSAAISENSTQVACDNTALSDFCLDEWMATHLSGHGPAMPYNGGTKWQLDACPFNPEHKSPDSVIYQGADGEIAFKCSHNSCAGNDWHKLREMLEPGCYDHPHPVEYPDVDLSGLLKKSTQTTKCSEESQKAAASCVKAEETDTDTQDEQESEQDDDNRPWRSITTDDVEAAIEGTALGDLAKIYASVADPPIPLECALMKAVVTAGCCLSGEESEKELKLRYPGNLGIINLVGADKARVKIDTSGGQLCNVYGLIVAPSATGKDIGGLIGKFARMTNPDIYHLDQSKNHADWNLASSSSSAEGLASMLIKKPNGLLSISEMSIWLDKNNWQYKAADFLTEAFGQGFFDQNFSDRSRGASNSRCTDYCAPNIIGNIQPEVFTEKVSMQDVATGFLGRFLMTILPEYYGNPAVYDGIQKQLEIQKAIQPYLGKHDVVQLSQGYSADLQEIFMGHTQRRLAPSWRRLCNEYYPRLMVMLSVTNDVRTRECNVIITEDTIRRARTLVFWFFSHAERILSGILEGEGNARLIEKAMRRMFCIVRDHGGKDGISLGNISHLASGSGTTAKDRLTYLQELKVRGWIEECSTNRFRILHAPPELMLAKKYKR